jgi:hypothetical protein
MLARRRTVRLLTGFSGLAAAIALGGCSQQGHWSPTADAMAGANRRAEYIVRADSPNAGVRTVVLSQDNYGRMANPSIMVDSSNTTVTAGVETGE